MATKLYSTLALACALSTPTFAADALRGAMMTPDRYAVFEEKIDKAIQRGDASINLASPGGMSMYGWALGQQAKAGNLKVRCDGQCNSAAAILLIASGKCVTTLNARVVLHAPRAPSELPRADQARVQAMMDNDWRRDMVSIGVPADIAERAIQNPLRVTPLSRLDLKRVGCEVE